MGEKPVTIDLDQEEQKIETEIREWSSNVIEMPNPNFKNIPTCPYAKAAWEKDLVKIVFDHDSRDEQLLKYISKYDDEYDLIIVVETDYDEDQEGFHNALAEVNSLISQDVWGDSDLWVMGFHPYDDESEVLDDESFEPISEYSYGLVFIQRLSLLQEASNKLELQGYYDVYSGNSEITEMYEIRKDYYRRFLDEKKRNARR
jgi:hypothetical protein|tara:strand:+ start:2032 stop:2637 length:606 start_codon:yes stop_codon:yes gene_type:complete